MRIAMITGATGGLGKALARRFDAEGWGLILSGRKDNFPSFSQKPICCVGNIQSQVVLSELYRWAKDGGVDVLINCAGVRFEEGFSTQHGDRIGETIDTNLICTIELTHKLWPVFKQQRKGLIVNIGSLAAREPGRGEAAYAASKVGLEGFSRALQWDATEIGVRVLHVTLGAMRTEMTAGRDDQDKLMDPIEVAKTIYDLCEQPDSLRVTETTIQRRAY